MSTSTETKIKLKLKPKDQVELIPEVRTPVNQQVDSGKNKDPSDRPKLQCFPTLPPFNYTLVDMHCTSKGLCDVPRCKRCYERSFCMKKRSEQWSEENLPTVPRLVTQSSGIRRWFNCPKCGHTYKCSPNSIETGTRDRGCPICANQQLCISEECTECYGRSFAGLEQSKNWSPLNGDLRPRDIFRSGKDIIWLRCPKCTHDYQIKANSSCRGRECSYCASKTLCDNQDCMTCYKNSFASHEMSKYWSKQNDFTPRTIFIGSNKLCWFTCQDCGHDFQTCPNNIVNLNTWCPVCHIKTELKLYNWLLTKYPCKRCCSYEWCISDKGCYMPFDFVIEDLKLIIELDGIQHFKQVMNWKDPQEQQKNDIYKMKKALEQGYSCIRILQNDVYRDHNDWQMNLTEAIKKYEQPTIIYIDNGGMYDIYKTQNVTT
jgi:hypothetical protein